MLGYEAMGLARELTQLAKVAAVSAGVTCFVVNEIGFVAKVEGNSMQPTFNPGCDRQPEYLSRLKDLTRDQITEELKIRSQQDRVILDKYTVARDKTKLRVGDVVIFISPKEPNKTLIKRITAMPGDIIQIIETGEVIEIDEGHCWVEGDNQQASYDSYNFGQIPLGLIRGRVCYIVWPFNRLGKIDCDPQIPSRSTKTILLVSRG